MKAFRLLLVLVLCIFASALICKSSLAQWTGGSMQVDTSFTIVKHGNYTYSNSSAYVQAIGPVMDYSTIQVKYKQVWTNNSNMDTINLNPVCKLTGSSSGPSCSSGCETDNGNYGKTISGTSSYDITFTFSALPTAYPTTTTGYFTLSAFSYGITGSDARADSTALFNN